MHFQLKRLNKFLWNQTSQTSTTPFHLASAKTWARERMGKVPEGKEKIWLEHIQPQQREP
jgi:hypothetical protein